MGIHGWSAFRRAGLAATALIVASCAPAHAAARPDLLPTKLSYPAGVAQQGVVYTTRATIENAGSANAGRSTTGFYLSLDTKRDGRDVRLGGVAVKSIAAGHGVRVTKKFSLPAHMSPGTYRVLVCADDTKRVKESHEGNDCLASKPALTVGSQPQPQAQLSVHLDPPPPEEQATPPPVIAAQATPASVSLNAPLDGAFVRSGAVSLGGTTSVHSLVTIEIFTGSSAAGAPAETIQALPAPDGTWTAQPSPELIDGTWTVRAEATGSLGDLAVSAARTFTVDSVAPAVAITLDPASPDGDGGTYTVMPAVHAAMDDANLESAVCSVDGAPAMLENAAHTAGGDLTVSGEGAHTVSCDAIDQAAWTTAVTRSFTVRSVAPVVSLVQPADGASTNDATPSFGGAAGTGSTDLQTVTVPVYRGSSATGTPVATLTATGSGGTWSATPSSALADGTYTALARQSNEAGDVGSSAAHTFTVDTAAPSPTVAHPAAGTSLNTATPTLDGAAGTAAGDAASVTVKVYAGSSATGTAVRTITAPVSGGGWSATPAALTDGDYTVQATQTDAAGNSGTSAARTFKVDTAAPAVTLAHPGAGATNDATPAFDGAAGTAAGDSANVTVKVYAGSAASGTPVQVLSATASSGGWSVTPSAALADGAYTAVAEQADAAGNTGSSASRTFTVDTAAPAVTLAHPAAGMTKNASPAFDGAAGTATGDSTTITVKLYSGSSTGGTPLRTMTATPSGGSWSATPSPALPDGTYTARAEQTDAAGNTGTSTARTFTVDTSAPAVGLDHPADGSATADATPTFDGTGGTASGDGSTVTIKVYGGTAATGTPLYTFTSTAGSGGAWSTAPSTPLADGTYTAQAEQSDSAGNTGRSATRTFTIDTTAPTVTLAHPAAGALVAAATSFDGTASTAAGDSATVTVKIYSGGSASGTPARTLTATASGGSWSVALGSGLADGTYTAQAEQSDSAGNTGKSAARTFTVDSIAPAVTLTGPAAGSTTNDATPAFSGAAGTAPGDSPAVTVKLYSGSSASGTPVGTLTATAAGGSWSVTPGANLADGTYTAQAEQSDTAGNTGKSAARTFTVDSIAPVPSITSPAQGATSDDQTVTISGSAGSGAGDATTVTVKIFNASGAQVQSIDGARASDGSWSVVTQTLPVGSYTARAQQSDAAGNTGTSTARGFSTPGVLEAAGDIASCDQTGDSATAALLGQNPADAVAVLGDNAYEQGSSSDYNNCYGPTWGTYKAKTHPALGNHEYATTNASGYFGYFGSAAGTSGQGWYSYDLGSWHVVVLNTSEECWPISCAKGSAQEQWLKADLQNHASQCTLAYWHHPLFTSDGLAAADSSPEVKPFWDDLYAAGADVVLNGHAHQYERFAPQSPEGISDPATGITEFVAGTGGYSEHPLSATPANNSLVRNNDTFGVLRLVLRAGGYSWRFLPQAGKTFTDSGSASCH